MKPSIPKGTRDFSPQEMVKRNFIFDTIRQVYQSYGYQPIETPAMENLETLMGKYGDEGDRLIFKILNSGDYLEGVSDANKSDSKSLTKHISEKALRYDLTVPFARYVVQHRNDITFPFKRYQIQPVWRADRPQKGRYREFYQCDADVIGSDSLLNEVELIQMIDEVFTKLGAPVIIKINNRKILQGVAEIIGAPDKMVDIATAIDKVEKIGRDGIMKELTEKGFLINQIEIIQNLVFFLELGSDLYDGRILAKGPDYWISKAKSNIDSLSNNSNYRNAEIFNKGIIEIENILNALQGLLKTAIIQFDSSIARGLNYYTGTIIEVKIDNKVSQFSGSLCGGGRYDDLTGVFGLPGVSGVGISFGADRIYDVMEELGKFPKENTTSTKVLFLNFGGEAIKPCLNQIKLLHEAGISAQLYPDDKDVKKIGKQIEYAGKMNIPLVVSIGDNEIKEMKAKIKIVNTGEEEKVVSISELITVINETLQNKR